MTETNKVVRKINDEIKTKTKQKSKSHMEKR